MVNNGKSRYYVFREALVKYLRSSAIPAEIVSIDPQDHGDRHYFEVAILPEAFRAREG
jgi:hypothetical protein